MPNLSLWPQEGKRLLRSALTPDEEGDASEQASVDYSIITNRDDDSVESELEGLLQYEAEQELATRPSAGTKANRRSKKWKDQYDDGDGDRHRDLDEAVDELGEKRDATKIQALRKILALLGGEVLSDRIDGVKATLTAHTLACLKRRMKESAPLALRTLSVLAITIGADALDYYEGRVVICVRKSLVLDLRLRVVGDLAEIEVSVQRAFTDEGDTARRVEAAYTLSIACFVCCPEDQQKWDVLDVLGSFLLAAKDAEDDEDAYPEELIMAAIECWAFLVSFFPPKLIVARMYDSNSILSEHVEAVAAFVRDGIHQSVRSSACEALALLVQLKYLAGKGSSSWSYGSEPDSSPIGGLEQKIAGYMRETAKSIGKKNRKQQRSTLKEVLETLRTGDGPFSELQVEDETLSISTWDRFFQAQVFRRALQSGFQVRKGALVDCGDDVV